MEGLRKTYGDVIAINAVSTVLGGNSIVGLVGPNGAGKTTLLKAVSDFLAPDSGSMLLNGQQISPGMVAYVPEFPDLFAALTVWEHFKYMALAYRVADWEQKSSSYLERLQLMDKKDALATELSKGMRQKVMIGISLLRQPAVLLLDEPFSGLDPYASRELRELILELKSKDRIIVVSSHNLITVQNICSRVLLMDAGKLVRDQDIEDIRYEMRSRGFDTLEDFFMEVTYGSG